MFCVLSSALLGAVALVNAQGSGGWAQCGGTGWAGSTTCISGWSCVYSNPYYSQCLPASASSLPAPVPTSTPTVPSSTAAGGGSSTPSSTATGPTPTGSQIRSDQDPAYHLYLQDIGGVPILGPEASSGYFTIGSTITLNSVNGTELFLNIDTSATTSYKPLTFDTTATTTTWGLSGDTIIYGNQQNFIVCPITGSGNFNLYLSTSNDMPSGCTNYITIHLPCLC